MATIKDVAREAGVTSATVSYVLNNSGRVSEATRQRVLAAARRLEYRPSAIAQKLRAGQSRIIGYAWHVERPGEWTAVMQQFMYTMSLAAERAGYHVLTFVADPDQPILSYTDLASTGQVDGFVLADTVHNDPRIRHLLDLNIPFAAFGQANEDWDFAFVDVDGASGMRQVTQHLLAAGHQRIGFINWPHPSLTGENRAAGYVQTLEQAGITAAKSWLVESDNTAQGGYAAARQLMALPESLRPTAIACVSDIIAIGAMRFLIEAGYRVGPDVALTGFDDTPSATHLTPTLTSVRQPLDQIGERVIEMLLALLQTPDQPKPHLLLEPVLIVRASSGGPA